MQKKRKVILLPAPPLAFQVLDEVQRVERYALEALCESSKNGCLNFEKASRIMCACAAKVFDLQMDYFISLADFDHGWIQGVWNKTKHSFIGLLDHLSLDPDERWQRRFLRDRVDEALYRCAMNRADEWNRIQGDKIRLKAPGPTISDLASIFADLAKRADKRSGGTPPPSPPAEQETRAPEAGTPEASKQKPTPPSPSPSCPRKRIDEFIDAIWSESGRRIRRSDIWRVAGYTEATQFERYQRDKRISAGVKARFDRILKLAADQFLERLNNLK